MDKKNKTILTVLSVLTLLVALLGATFAYYSATSKSEPQIITTSSLSLSINIDGSINVDNIKPTNWVSLASAQTNKDITRIPFTVSSPAGVKAVYSVNMDTVIPSNSELTGGDASDIKYKLFKDGETTPLKEGSFSSNFNEQIITNSEIALNTPLNDKYVLYVYIENENAEQNTLQNISFSINLTGRADQVE